MLLGGAALTRAFVEQDLADVYDGEVRYARDAFEGLRLMDAVMAVKRGEPGRRAAGAPQRRVRGSRRPARSRDRTRGSCRSRSDVAARQPGARRRRSGATAIVKGIALADYAAVPRRARHCSWASGGCKPSRGDGPGYEELVETEGRPRLRMWLDRIQTEGLLEAAVVYGYFPCYSEGDDLVVLHHEGPQAAASACASLPAAAPRPAPCLADFFRARGVRRGRRGRFTRGHDGPARRRGDRTSSSRPTPTATTWSCTACRSS